MSQYFTPDISLPAARPLPERFPDNPIDRRLYEIDRELARRGRFIPAARLGPEGAHNAAAELSKELFDPVNPLDEGSRKQAQFYSDAFIRAAMADDPQGQLEILRQTTSGMAYRSRFRDLSEPASRLLESEGVDPAVQEAAARYVAWQTGAEVGQPYLDVGAFLDDYNAVRSALESNELSLIEGGRRAVARAVERRGAGLVPGAFGLAGGLARGAANVSGIVAGEGSMMTEGLDALADKLAMFAAGSVIAQKRAQEIRDADPRTTLAPSRSLREGGVFQPNNPRWWTEMGLEAIVDMGASFAAGAVGAVGGPAGSAIAVGATNFGAAFGEQFSEAYDDLIARGVPEEQALEIASVEASLYGVGSSILENIPIAQAIRLFKTNRAAATKGLREYVAGVLSDASKQALIEGTTEAAQEGLSIATGALVSGREVPEDWLERVAAGATLGALAGGVAGGATGAASRLTTTPGAPGSPGPTSTFEDEIQSVITQIEAELANRNARPAPRESTPVSEFVRNTVESVLREADAAQVAGAFGISEDQARSLIGKAITEDTDDFTLNTVREILEVSQESAVADAFGISEQEAAELIRVVTDPDAAPRAAPAPAPRPRAQDVAQKPPQNIPVAPAATMEPSDDDLRREGADGIAVGEGQIPPGDRQNPPGAERDPEGLAPESVRPEQERAPAAPQPEPTDEAPATVDDADQQRTPSVLEREGASSLSDRVLESMRRGDQPSTPDELAKLAGVNRGTPEMRLAEEEYEFALVRRAREIAQEKSGDPNAAFDELVELYNRQPKLATRTGSQTIAQAYSTPAPIAYLASRLAGVRSAKRVYEPTAGNGMLLVESHRFQSDANELDPRRAGNLRRIFRNVTENDAVDFRPEGEFDAIVMNPPFGAIPGGKRPEIAGLTVKKIDHAIALRALEGLKPDGRAVLILGGPHAKALGNAEEIRKHYRGSLMPFYSHLLENYKVDDHFIVDGKLYERQGAAWPVEMIVISGRGKSDRPHPGVRAGVPRVLNTFDQLKELLNAAPEVTVAPETGAGDVVARPERPQGERQPAGPRGLPAGPRPPAREDVPPRDRGAGDRAPRPDAGDRGRVPVPDSQPVGGVDAREPAQRGDVREDGEGQRPAEPQTVARDELPVGPAQPERVAGDQEQAPDRPVGEGDVQRPDRGDDSSRIRLSEEQVEGLQVPWVNTSKGKGKDDGFEYMVPTSLADPQQSALAALADRRGDLDEFVRKELGYKDKEELYDALSAVQIEAVALAIDNIERGQAVILGEQMGVGKGREGAAIVRYAQRKGKIPIYLSQGFKHALDVQNYLKDIGLPGQKPFVLAGDSSIPDGEDDLEALRQLKPGGVPKQLRTLEAIASSRALPSGTHFIFTTYSQIRQQGPQTKSDGAPANWKRRVDAIRSIAPDAIVVLDEAHVAGSDFSADESKSRKKKSKDGSSYESIPGGVLVRDTFENAHGLVYMSGTFAKRPENLGLYTRSAAAPVLHDAETLSAGGEPIIQAFTSMLAKSGGYLRREQDLSNVKIEFDVRDAEHSTVQGVSASLAAILDFDLSRADFIKEIKESGADNINVNVLKDPSTGKVGVETNNFTSVMHNLIGQALLAIKAPIAAQEAIDQLKAGRKPILAVASTMNSAIADIADSLGIPFGQEVDLDFGDVMRRALERTRTITIKDAKGSKTKYRLRDDEIDTEKYQAALDAIAAVDWSNVPISPIDYIKQKVSEAGYTIGEITGRDSYVDYSGAKPVLRKKSSTEVGDAAKIATNKGFQNGDLDAVIMNRSGSTGLNFHADARVKDQGQRALIILQPEANIADYAQLLLRPYRTGQTSVPIWKQIVSSAPAEKRVAANLARKMARLNAQTTSRRKGAFSSDAPDMMNKVGDEVAADFLTSNPDIAGRLDIRLGKEEEISSGAFAKLTGRMPALRVEEQEAIYTALERMYEMRIEELERKGESPLEAKVLPIEAETIEKKVYSAGNENSPNEFERPSYIEEIRAKILRKPYTPEYVAEESGKLRSQGIESIRLVIANAFRAQEAAIRASAFGSESAKIARIAKANENAKELYAFAKDLYSSMLDGLRLFNEKDDVLGIPIRFGPVSEPATVNPGAWKLVVAVPDDRREVSIPMSQVLDKGTTVIRADRSSHGTPLMTLFSEAQNNRTERRYILTGNVVAGFVNSENRGGQVAQITRKGGGIEFAVVMPRSFDPARDRINANVVVPSVKDAMAFFRQGHRPHYVLAQGDLTIGRHPTSPEEFVIVLRAQRQEAIPYFESLRKIEGFPEFVKKGGEWRATFSSQILEPVVQTIMDDGRSLAFKERVVRTSGDSGATTVDTATLAAKNLLLEMLGQEKITEAEAQKFTSRPQTLYANPFFSPGAWHQMTASMWVAGKAIGRASYDAARRGGSTIGKAGLELADELFTQLIDVLTDASGSSSLFAERANRVMDAHKRKRGAFSTITDPGKKMSSGLWPGSRNAVSELNRIVWTGRSGSTVFQLAMESDAELAKLGAHAARIVRQARKLNEATGVAAERAGIMRTDPATKQRIPFRHTPGGRVMLRFWSPEAWDVLARGVGSRGFSAIVDAFMDANGFVTASERAAVEAKLSALATGASDAPAEMAQRQVNFEFFRELKHAPTHVRINDRIIPVLEADPFRYFDTVSDSSSRRLAFVEEFGQDYGSLDATRKRIATEGGPVHTFDALHRSLNGMPVFRSMFPAGSDMYPIAKANEAMMTVFRAGGLTLATAANISETARTVPALFGVRRMILELARLGMTPGEIPAVYQNFVRMGAIVRDIPNWNIETGRRGVSTARLLVNAATTINGFRLVNEANEFFAALGGQALASDLSRGRVALGDGARLIQLGFSEQEAADLVAGRGKARDYERIIRAAPSRTQFTSAVSGERARFEAWAGWRHAFLFSRFFLRTAGQTLRVTRKLAESVVAFGQNPTKENADRVAGNLKVASLYFFGNAVAGIGASMLGSMLRYGFPGLLGELEDLYENPWEVFVHGLEYSLVGGPTKILVEALTGDGIAKNIEYNIFGLGLFTEMRDFMAAEGRYSGMTALERSSTFLKSRVPITGAMSSLAGALGLGGRDAELSEAIRRYYQWRRDNLSSIRDATRLNEEEDTIRFRRHLARAVAEMRSANARPEVVERHLLAAMEVEGKDARSVRASLLGRRLLHAPGMNEERRQAMRGTIGERRYLALERYDEVLELWASKFSSQRGREYRPTRGARTTR